MANEQHSIDLKWCIEEGRKASEALLTTQSDPEWRGIMLWVADAVAEECLIRLQQDAGSGDA